MSSSNIHYKFAYGTDGSVLKIRVPHVPYDKPNTHYKFAYGESGAVLKIRMPNPPVPVATHITFA